MKTIFGCLVVVIALGLAASPAHATFSIVAVDTVTGAIGGAGASCISGSFIINDIIEGIGAAHTQAWYISQNQQNAHNLLASGLDPDSIIGWLVANDAESFPQLRQYGVVTLAGQGASAGFTGSWTDDWKGHLTGPGYAIQGNILLGPEIIDSMEFVYLNTPGPLEERLMAALQAARVPGADTRCLAAGKSAISAFIKVVHPGDGGTPYLQQVVGNTVGSTDPIDVLQGQYDAWKAATQQADSLLSTVAVAPDTLEADGDDTAHILVTPLNSLGEPPTMGAQVSIAHTGPGTLSAVVDNGNGTFSASLTAPLDAGEDTVIVTVDAGGVQTTLLAERPVVVYYVCGDVDNSGGIPLVTDLTHLVDYLFKAGPPPAVLVSGNIDGLIGPGGPIDVADLSYLVAFLFQSGPPPVCE